MSGKYKEIEVSSAGGPFEAAEWECVKAGDRFRFTAPASVVDGRIWIAESDATPVPGEPENWAIHSHPEAAPLLSDPPETVPAMISRGDLLRAPEVANPWMGIAQNHDLTKNAVGRMRQLGYTFQVELFRPMSKEEIYKIFGDIGMLARETVQLAPDGEHLISKFEILEFSYSAVPAEPRAAPFPNHGKPRKPVKRL